MSLNRANSILGPFKDSDAAFCHLPELGFSMFLAERTKTIHFVRHAEGYHNVITREYGDETPTIYSTPGSDKYLDARLTEAGVEQCEQVRESTADGLRPQLVVVSPLTRTLETCHIMFGGREHQPKFIVHDLCRERMGKYTNDKRRPSYETIPEFKELYESTGDRIDFTSFGFDTDEDEAWAPERESDAECTSRAMSLIQWLMRRPETEIAVVTHSSFLRHLFSEFGDNLSKADRSILQRKTANAEIRSVVLAGHRGCQHP